MSGVGNPNTTVPRGEIEVVTVRLTLTAGDTRNQENVFSPFVFFLIRQCVVGLSHVYHRAGRDPSSHHCPPFDKQNDRPDFSQGLAPPELSFNESFKASIITLKITTLGYRVMPPFCWNLFIIWFLSTLLSCKGWALPLARGTSGGLGLCPDWWVLSGAGFTSPAITCNEEVIFWAQYLLPTLQTNRDISYPHPAIFSQPIRSQSARAGANQSPEEPPGDKKVFAPFRVVTGGLGPVIMSRTV